MFFYLLHTLGETFIKMQNESQLSYVYFCGRSLSTTKTVKDLLLLEVYKNCLRPNVLSVIFRYLSRIPLYLSLLLLLDKCLINNFLNVRARIENSCNKSMKYQTHQDDAFQFSSFKSMLMEHRLSIVGEVRFFPTFSFFCEK